VYEIQTGLALLPAGRRRATLQESFDAVLTEDLQQRVLVFDGPAASAAAAITARRQRAGLIIDIQDTQIAGIATARRGAIATRNLRHFKDLDVPVVSPWS
jgi:predicted nucleic acid-binding protein